MNDCTTMRASAAARALGITPDALRKRIERDPKRYRSHHEGQAMFVEVPNAELAAAAAKVTVPESELVTMIRDLMRQRDEAVSEMRAVREELKHERETSQRSIERLLALLESRGSDVVR